MSKVDQAKEFHEKHGIPVGKMGHMLTAERTLLRFRLIMEELSELIEATQLRDYPGMCHEAADLLYVTYGFAIEAGIPIDAVFDEIHRSNMTKDKSEDAGGKIVKGESYVPPDIEKVLTK
jgi:predicted HAD superfamily Cof-like phosphohydrolase